MACHLGNRGDLERVQCLCPCWCVWHALNGELSVGDGYKPSVLVILSVVCVHCNIN